MKFYSSAIIYSILISFLSLFITCSTIKQFDASKDQIDSISSVEPFDVSKWKLNLPPKDDSQEWTKANRSDVEWKVYIQNNNLMICITQEIDTISISVPNGTIHAVNGGEFGGEIYFKSSFNGQYKISEGNYVQFIKDKNTLYVLEGLAHLTYSDGKICILRFNGKRWKINDYVQLGDAPYAAALSGPNLFIVTSSKLFKVNLDTKNVQTIRDNMFWWGMYPNSIVLVDNCIYIGMRGGIAKISMDNYEVVWLTRD